MSASATVIGKNFNTKFTVKIDVLIGYFICLVTIADADIGSVSLSIHFSISICTTCWCNLNKIFQCLTIDKALTQFLKDVSVAETIV